MASTFSFEWFKESMIETEKAYGFLYGYTLTDNNGKVVWLPKSQTTLEEVEVDPEDIYSTDDAYIVTIPMWLARNNGYFKSTLLKVQMCY